MTSYFSPICILVVVFVVSQNFHGSTAARLRKEREFTANTNANNDPVCSSDDSPGELILVVKSEEACLLEAKSVPCAQFYQYWEENSECHLYSRLPQEYKHQPGCVSRTVISSLQRACGTPQLILQNLGTTAPSFNNASGWAWYKAGFGDTTTNYWIGLDALADLTSDGCSALMVSMTSAANGAQWAGYNTFIVGDECSEYLLIVGDYNQGSSALDALSFNTGLRFSTADRDKDLWDAGNCAATYTNSGWWYSGAAQHVYPCSQAYPTTRTTNFKWTDVLLTNIQMSVDCSTAALS